jgi:hypothetical protein
MSEWSTRVKDHRIWALMQAMGPNIDKAARLDGLDAPALEALERLRLVLTFCGKRLGGADPLTIPVATLDSLTGLLESINSEIVGFLSDQALNHLVTANTAADVALAKSSEIPAISTPQELVGLTEAAATHRAAVEEMMVLASESRKQAREEIVTLRIALEALGTQSQVVSAT